MVQRVTRRAMVAFATIATALLLVTAVAQAGWREPESMNANWSCGAYSYLTGLRFQECIKKAPTTNAWYVNSVMLVTNTATTPRSVYGSTESFSGPNHGQQLAYGDCPPIAIAAGAPRWCYSATEPVAFETPLYGIGRLFQPGEYSFAYSPTSFTAPTPPAPLPPPGTCSDCDGDGFQLGVDCVDNGPSINPGAIDVPGNGIDEDCSGADTPPPLLPASFPFDYRYAGRDTVISSLAVQPARAGWTIRVRCSGGGCPFKTRKRAVKKTRSKLNLLPFLHHARLRPHARLELQVTKPGTIGRSRVITMRSNKRPRRTDRCLKAGRKIIKCPL